MDWFLYDRDLRNERVKHVNLVFLFINLSKYSYAGLFYLHPYL